MSPFFKPTSTDSSLGKLNAWLSSIRLQMRNYHLYQESQTSQVRIYTPWSRPDNSRHRKVYLGVNINNKLSWNNHTDTITKRATQLSNFVRRDLSSCSASIREQCYVSVRPQLELCLLSMGQLSKTKYHQTRICSAKYSPICVPRYQRTSSVTAMLQTCLLYTSDAADE